MGKRQNGSLATIRELKKRGTNTRSNDIAGKHKGNGIRHGRKRRDNPCNKSNKKNLETGQANGSNILRVPSPRAGKGQWLPSR
jgi:hypothetical protein